MKEYIYTIKVRLEAMDDLDVRSQVEKVKNKIVAEVLKDGGESLREIFHNDSPRVLTM